MSTYKSNRDTLREVILVIILAIAAGFVLWAINLSFGSGTQNGADMGVIRGQESAQIRRSAPESGANSPISLSQDPEISLREHSGSQYGAA